MDITNYVSSNFHSILYQQELNKHHLIKEIKTPPKGFTIIIKNNELYHIVCDVDKKYQKRKKQYLAFFEYLLKYNTIKDCILNINIGEFPMDGYFNFCRLVDNSNQFLLPNFRFTFDDIPIDPPYVASTYQDTKILISKNDYSFHSKKNKIFNISFIHPNKLKYFEYALTHPFCEGKLYIGEKYKNFHLDNSFNLNTNLITKLKNNNMITNEFIPFKKHFDYKYILINNGNTMSDKMRILLNLNCIIIKEKSKYEEFYSPNLKNKENYFEFSNYEELENIYTYLENNLNVCIRMIKKNKKFARTTLDYKNILKYTELLINQSF